MNSSEQNKGVAASVAASCIFGAMYFYVTLLAPLDGEDVFGWRMVFTVPFLALFIRLAGYWELVSALARRVRNNALLAPALCLSSFLLGVQLWLFLWAPLNGKALDVSLGYLLMPLVMVVCGRFVYRDRLEGYQKLAVACAALGVANQVWQVRALSIEMLVVAFGFPLYFVLRRALKTDHLGGLFFDMTLTLPAAIHILSRSPVGLEAFAEQTALLALVPLLGAISAFAISLYVTAGRLLPLSLFGLLGYVEPVLLVLVSLLLGERMQPNEAPTYLLVFCAVLLLAVGGLIRAKRAAIPRALPKRGPS